MVYRLEVLRQITLQWFKMFQVVQNGNVIRALLSNVLIHHYFYDSTVSYYNYGEGNHMGPNYYSVVYKYFLFVFLLCVLSSFEVDRIEHP